MRYHRIFLWLSACTCVMHVLGQEEVLPALGPDYRTGLLAHHVISDSCYRLEYFAAARAWPGRAEALDSISWREIERGSVLSTLNRLARDRRDYLCYRAVNDSLQAKTPLKFANYPKSKLDEMNEERWWEINDRCRFPARIRERAWRSDMDWVPEGLYRDELLEKEGSARMLDSYMDSVPPLTLLEDLREVGLIDSALAGYLRRAIDRGGVDDAEAVFMCASTVRQLPGNRERREKQRLLAQELVDMKAMSAEKAEELDRWIDSYEEHDHADIAAVCLGAYRMDLAMYHGGDVRDFYRTAYAGVYELLEGAVNDDLHLRTDTIVSIAEDAIDDVGSKYVRTHFRFSAGGRSYGDSITERAFDVDGRTYIDLDPYRFLGCVNKALCDQGSDHRMWALEDFLLAPCQEFLPQAWVFLPVTRGVARLWYDFEGWPFDTTNISPLSFAMQFCSDDIEDGVKDFQDAGVLSHLSEHQVDSSQALASMTLHRSWLEVFSVFPNVLISGSDLTDVDIRRGTPGVLPRLINASHGAFRPTRVKERWERAGDRATLTSLAFSLGGKRYRGGGGPVAIMAMINRALGASGAPGRWYSMEEPYRRSFIFLTRDQYDALRDTYVGDYLQRWE